MIPAPAASGQPDRDDAFDNAVDALRTRHQANAEWGPAAQLSTLADQLTSEISAAAVEAFENTTRGSWRSDRCHEGC